MKPKTTETQATRIYEAPFFLKISSLIERGRAIEICKIAEGQIEISIEERSFFGKTKRKSYGLGKTEIRKLIRLLEESLKKRK